jgi:hypothetical protein
MSKAIKTAVAKWGVGLYLEKGSASEGSGAGSWGPPNIPIPVVEQPKISPVAPPVAAPIAAPVTAPIAAPVATPVNIPPGNPNIPFAPVPEAQTTDPLGVGTPVAPVFTDDNVVVTQPNPSAGFNPPMDSIPVQGATAEGLTDVQKVAIENIMSVHSKPFAELAPAALQRTDNLPNSVEALSYQDAVKLIQYGNNLNAGS